MIARSFVFAFAATFASFDCRDARAAVSLPMNVMTCNVRVALASDGANAWTERNRFLCETILEFRPDVLGLQEAVQEQLDAIVEALPQHTSTGEARDGGREGEYSAIVYDTTRLQLLESDTFWLSSSPEKPSVSWGNTHMRVCTWARFADRQSGRVFSVFNTHLDHQSENARLLGTRLILDRIQTIARADPCILTGDFNADESSPPIRAITDAEGGAPEDLPRFADSFRLLHPNARDVGTFHGFKGTDDGRKIDYIFVTRHNITVQSAAILRVSRGGRHPSDHHPVTAVITLAQPAENAP